MAKFNFDLDNAQPRAEHFYLVVSPERLLCWGFELRLLGEAYGKVYGDEVFKAILEGLKDLSQTKNRCIREQRFALWCGDYSDGFWVGVTAKLSSEVVEILGCHLQRVAGYRHKRYGHIASLQLTPFFMYDHGRVIEYSDDSVAGLERQDAYSSGMMVSYRLLW
jgi:hypothetical protein